MFCYKSRNFLIYENATSLIRFYIKYNDSLDQIQIWNLHTAFFSPAFCKVLTKWNSDMSSNHLQHHTATMTSIIFAFPSRYIYISHIKANWKFPVRILRSVRVHVIYFLVKVRSVSLQYEHNYYDNNFNKNNHTLTIFSTALSCFFKWNVMPSRKVLVQF